MQKTIDFTKQGGLFVYQDTLGKMQTAYTEAVDAITTFFGDKIIISGLVPAGGNLSNGVVIFNNQLWTVTGAAQQTYLEQQITEGKESFADGTQKKVYYSNSLVFTALASATTVAFADFKRLPFSSSTLKDALNKSQNIIKGIANTEPAVIISGCVVSNVGGTTSGICDISAGVVLFNGEYIASPQRVAGSFPCYLKSDGTYVNVLPPFGDYITFDYETSQRLKHVQKRNMYGSGETLMSTAAADLALFDLATGLGKWKWKGWKLSYAMRSRVPVGYDNRNAQPALGDLDNEAWDNVNRTLGNKFGSREVRLTEDELPEIQPRVNTTGNQTGVDPGKALQRSSTIGDGYNSNGLGDAGAPYIEKFGGDEPHENRMPSTVVLYIERI